VEADCRRGYDVPTGWQAKRESAAPGQQALSPDRTSVQLNYPLADREPETIPDSTLLAKDLDLAKLLENHR